MNGVGDWLVAHPIVPIFGVVALSWLLGWFSGFNAGMNEERENTRRKEGK